MKARDFDTIYSDHLQEKQNLPNLLQLQTNVSDVQTLNSELSSDSKVALWALEIFTTDRVIWTFEQILAEAVKEIETIRDQTFSGNPLWIIDRAKQFQYGSNIEVDEITKFVPAYSVIDTSKQIIQNASIIELNGKVVLKVRGKVSNILSDDEFNSFVAYVRKFKFAGQRILVQNLEADKIKISGTIRYNGTYVLSDVKSAVEVAINNYIQNISFDSYLIRTDLIDAVKAVAGVKDFEINILESKGFSDLSYIPIAHRVSSYAGYFEVDPDYALENYIIYDDKV